MNEPIIKRPEDFFPNPEPCSAVADLEEDHRKELLEATGDDPEIIRAGQAWSEMGQRLVVDEDYSGTEETPSGKEISAHEHPL
ncbi:MAG: hypothetical protein Q7S57_06070 [bacterium]|nr:hypothetical protein [bacterium]